jgi:ribosome maturation factor RimP
MVRKEDIEKIIIRTIEGTDAFLVDVDVKSGNLIRVFVDEPSGISLDECIRISKVIESSLDREEEDFDLQVSSPGLENPLLVLPQYIKNIGRELKVETLDKQRFVGELISADQIGISLKAKIKVKLEGSKKKKTELQSVSLKFEEIKSAKVNLQFKG